MVVADDDGLPRAFLNRCRHRGSRLVDEPEGRIPRLQCPYHAWTYGFDGSLKNAPFTDELEDFDPACNGLQPVRLAVVEGLVLLDLSGEAPPPAEHVGELAEHLAHYRLGDLRRGARIVYDVDANWKAIAENYSECLHCPGVHPELNRLSHYLSGESVLGAGAWCGGSMTLSDDAETMAREGGTNHRPPIAGLTEEQIRSVYYYLLFPNTLVSLHPDYVMLHTLWPRAADRTEVVCEWLFEPATMEAGGLRPAGRGRLLGPGQPRGLGRLHGSRSGACAVGGVVAGRYTMPGGRRPRVRRDGRRQLPRGHPARRSRDEHRHVSVNGKGAASGGSSFDAIVVGGGHNGLTAAAYLARAGPARLRARAPAPARRRVRHRGALARPARVARVVRRLDAAAEGRRRPRARRATATRRSRSTPSSRRSPPTGQPILLPQRRARHLRAGRARVAQGRRQRSRRSTRCSRRPRRS